MTLILHQFPISHYCEKVRWALDYKGLDYRLKNHLPGQHLKAIRKVAPKSNVPVLEHDGRFIQNSPDIISYLDEHFPDKPLTPSDPVLREQATRWETFCDEQIGPHVRRYCYDTLLQYPNLVIPFFAQGGPFWSKLFLKIMFSRLETIMRKVMAIHEPHVSESRKALEDALQTLTDTIENRSFLVGETFTRADLAAASLLAPLFMPPEYGLDWPQTVPQPLQGWVERHQAQLQWPSQLYRRFR